MNLGIILASGDSFKNMVKNGQYTLFKNFYLKKFSKRFSKVYVFSYENENPKDLPENVVVVSNKFSSNRFLSSLLMPFLNFRETLDIDVFRAYHLFGTMPVIITKIFFQKPFIFNYAYDYEKIATIEGKSMQILLLRFVKPFAIYLASKIFVANKELFNKINSGKLIYLPNGTDVNFFKPQKVKKQNRIINILSVGRLERQKNFENLIKALKKLNVKLTIIGQGSLKNKLLSLSKVCKVDLTLMPFIKNKDMPKIYNKADIFVLPSLSEGSPKVLLEAMACQLAVIVTNVEGSREIFNNTNGVKCQTSSDSIKKAIISLSKNPNLRKKLAVNARNFIIKNFDLKFLLDKEINALKNLSK